jgi:hypothetical protein
MWRYNVAMFPNKVWSEMSIRSVCTFIMIFIRIKTETKITNLIKFIEQLALPASFVLFFFSITFFVVTLKIVFPISIYLKTIYIMVNVHYRYISIS